MPAGPSTTLSVASSPSGTWAPVGVGMTTWSRKACEVLAVIPVVAQVDRVALQSFDRRGERHAAQGHGQHVLHVAEGQAVAGDGVAIDFELDVFPAHDAFGVGAGGARHLADHGFDLRADPFQRGQVGAGHLDADRRLDAGGKHVNARLDRHGPGVGQAGELDRAVHRVHQFVRRAPAVGDDVAVVVLDVHCRPFLFRFEHDGGFDHVERRGIGGGVRAADLAEDVFHFREAS